MFLRKEGIPEEGELVLCTINNIHFHSVFAKLDEYNKSGLIHISEVSPGRIRNIRDFVSEGKKVVCKVIRVNAEKGHIDLSLRRVNESQRRNKISEIKLEQMAEKIVEQTAKKTGTQASEIYASIMGKLKGRYSSLYAFFEDVSFGKASLKEISLKPKAAEELEELIKSATELGVSFKMCQICFDAMGVSVDDLIVPNVEVKGVSEYARDTMAAQVNLFI